MDDPIVIKALAPAKLNLALAVDRRDTGGLHPICSWMVTIDLCDELTVTRLADDRLSRYAILWHEDAGRKTEIDWSITRDLAVRAHLALEEHVGRRLPVQLKLEKRIAVGGGLAGGSSDAAAMLRAVNDLFRLALSLDELAEIGARLGSDIPFMVYGGSAIVEGTGDTITRHETTPELHAVLALPDVSCETRRVYELFDNARPPEGFRPDAVKALVGGVTRPDLSEALFNDLAAPAVAAAPALEEAMARLADLAERRAHVTGSGSGLFVVCDDPMHATALAEAVVEKLGLPAMPIRTGIANEVSGVRVEDSA